MCFFLFQASPLSTLYSEFMKHTAFVGVLVLGIFLLDICVFRFLFWRIPNEAAWNSRHFYNFLYEWKKTKRTPKVRPRVFLLGSSIAYYSTDREILKQEIQKWTGVEVDVEYFSYAGNSPLCAYLFLDNLFALKPDLVIYPLNFIDFRLHRPFIVHPQNPSVERSEEDLLLADAATEVEAPQSAILFPLEMLLELWKYMDWERRGQLWIAGIFKFYAYKDLFLDVIGELYSHRFGRNSSYHAYNGVQIPERVNSLGWTSRQFSFRVTKKIRKEGFWIEVVGEFFKKGPLEIRIYPYRKKDDPNVHVQSIFYTTSGWKQVVLDEEFFQEEAYPFLTVELSHVWYAYEADGFLRDYHRDPMGVRLTQTFGLEEPKKNVHYTREERLEDLRYVDMDDKTYREYFFYRLLEDLEKRPGIRYLYEIQNAKKQVSKERFRPILHFRYLAKIADRFREEKVPLLLINHPENPISLEWYVNSKWYRGYLEYLNSLQGDGVRVLDWKDKLRMQDFSDFHHLTYPGMLKMNPCYAKAIAEISAF